MLKEDEKGIIKMILAFILALLIVGYYAYSNRVSFERCQELNQGQR